LPHFRPSSWLPGALLALASAAACGAPVPASGAASGVAAPRPASAACPARAESAGLRTSKLRHALDEDDPCADSRGRGTPIRRLAPASGASLDDRPGKP